MFNICSVCPDSANASAVLQSSKPSFVVWIVTPSPNPTQLLLSDYPF